MTQQPIPDAPRQRLLFALLLFGTALLLLWQLGRLPLLDVDEPVYGQVAKEMASAGWAGWLTPHYNGAIWFDKPPLFYWLSALSVRIFGVSEWADRLPSALLGIALVAVTYALARRAFPTTPRAGLWAGFVLATSAQFFLLGHAAVTDMTLAVCLTTALLALFCWNATGGGRWMVLAGLMTGLAALAKGPVAIVLLGAQMVVFLFWTRQARRLLSPALWGGFLLCLGVSLPWYLAMIALHGNTFVQGFLEANNV
nr:glycosyltransferase family 39 protein [Armatimonadota bacterium]